MALKTVKHLLLSFLVFFCFVIVVQGQQDDPVLFTVENTPVHVSEFEYIYSKTNGKEANFSKESIEEYLDLYVKFKLKVQRAKELKLDTIPQLINELAGYRRQLADSYLIDRTVTEQLVGEAYKHIQEDVDISHILINVPANSSEEDVAKAYKRILDTKMRILNGEDFNKVAKEVSEDKAAPQNSGRLGFITAILPNGFYELEKAAYSTKIGEISDPIKTKRGYHLVKVHGKRPARGEVEVAHILIRVDKQTKEEAKTRIDSIYNALMNGADFEKLAQQVSEDKRSAPKNGYIGFFGINRYQKAFEEASFSLKEDGEISKPFFSSLGWHVVKRISKKDIQDFTIEKGRLEGQIKRDERFNIAKTAMIKKIKVEGNFTENKEPLNKFTSSLTDTFLTFRWKVPSERSPEVLFTLGKNYKATLGDFMDFLGRSSRKRIQMGRSANIEKAVDVLYQEFINEHILKFEESRLEDKYPAFKALMREYEEGILLFEATKMLVWDKASQDTVGLKKFFEKIKGKYRWEERAEVTEYRLRTATKEKAEPVHAFAKANTKEKILEKFNIEGETLIDIDEKKYEKSRNPIFNAMEWKIGSTSPLQQDRRKYYYFIKIDSFISPGPKSLKESRGYVVADYQDQLEKEWVETLRKRYKVKINQGVVDGLIKSNR